MKHRNKTSIRFRINNVQLKGVQIIQDTQNIEKISDNCLFTIGFAKQNENTFMKTNLFMPCRLIRTSNGKFVFLQKTQKNNIVRRTIMVSKIDLKKAIKELY
ncbi:MAG: hypothetical protein KBT06_09635, partial [Prevotellaceae bacterium]|nr:hypothetical protein [Candidatus Colivivens equi]